MEELGGQNWHKPPLVVGTGYANVILMEGERYMYGYKDKGNCFSGERKTCEKREKIPGTLLTNCLYFSGKSSSLKLVS